MKQVFYRCNTCVEQNELLHGLLGHIDQQTEFESLTDVINHVADSGHQMVAFVKDDTTDDKGTDRS